MDVGIILNHNARAYPYDMVIELSQPVAASHFLGIAAWGVGERDRTSRCHDDPWANTFF